MAKLVINSYDEFAAHLGEVLGTSEWLEVDQERINLFADATLDHQWIHVDVEKAKEEVLTSLLSLTVISLCRSCLTCGTKLLR
jgi:acyl dehydratase